MIWPIILTKLTAVRILTWHYSEILPHIFSHFFVCFYLYTSFKNKHAFIWDDALKANRSQNICWRGDVPEGTSPAVCGTQLLRNLWRCFCRLAHNTACFCRMTSDIKHPSLAFKAAAELSAKGIGPITPGEGSSRCAVVIWVPVSATDSCSPPVMLQKWSGPLIVALCMRPRQLGDTCAT